MKDKLRDRFCVIGGGIIGSWTALHLVRQGIPTLLVDQFPLGHEQGSSYGASRAIRMLDTADLNDLEYSMGEWRKLQSACGRQLFVSTGLINLGTEHDPFLNQCMRNLEERGYPVEWLRPRQLHQRLPDINYPGMHAAYDPSAGLLLADECLRQVRTAFEQLKGEIRSARVLQVDSTATSGVRVELETASGDVECMTVPKVVACPGPWTSKLFPELSKRLITKAIPVTYWQELDTSGRKVITAKESVYSTANGFPIIFNARLTNVYAFPSYEYPGLVKVLYHGGPEANPDARDQADFEPYVEHVRQYVMAHYPRLDPGSPAILEKCMYTCTANNQPILERLDEHLVLGTGFSGSGFKHSPAMGRKLALLAQG